MIPRLAILLSGSGSTLQNLIDRIADGRFAAQLVGVISSKPEVLGLERARQAGLPVAVVSGSGEVSDFSGSAPVASGAEVGMRNAESQTGVSIPNSDFRVPKSRSDAVFDVLRLWQPDFVVLAGWIHLLKIPDDFAHRVVNVHPSLLPAFGGKGMYGRHVHEAVLASGARFSGCTVHFADDTYDTGPIIHQAVVPVLDSDTPDTLAERVQAAEREAYPAAIAKLAAGGWQVVGKRLVWQ